METESGSRMASVDETQNWRRVRSYAQFRTEEGRGLSFSVKTKNKMLQDVATGAQGTLVLKGQTFLSFSPERTSVQNQ